jgi:hypothetical protein
MKFMLAAWFGPASVAVPLEGGGHFSPPGGWPEVHGPWPFGPKGPTTSSGEWKHLAK